VLEGVGDECYTPATLPVGKSPGTHCGGWWEPGPVWKGKEKGKYLSMGARDF